MPQNNELEIVLKLDDQATDQSREVKNRIKSDLTEIENAGRSAGKTINDQFKEAGRTMRDFRQATIVAGIAIAGIVATTKEWSKVNDNTKKAFDNLEKATKGLAATIGSLFAPAISAFSDLVVRSTAVLSEMFDKVKQGYAALFEGMTFGIQFNVAFFTSLKQGVGIAEAYRIAMKTAADATKELTQSFNDSLFQGGQQNIMSLGEVLVQDKKIPDKKGKGDKDVDELNKTKEAYKLIGQEVRNLQSALSSAGAENKKFAKAAAAVALAMAIVNTAQGITAALSGPPNGPPFPLNLALAALIAATGAIQIATISSQNFAQGTDTVPANLSPGEMVFPSSMASAIRRGDITVGGPGGIGGGSNINIYIQRADLGSERSVEDTAEMLGFKIEENLRLARGI